MTTIVQRPLVLDWESQLRLVPITQCDPDAFTGAYMGNLMHLALAGEASLDTTEQQVRRVFDCARQDMEEGSSLDYGVVVGEQLVGEVAISWNAWRPESEVHYWVAKAMQGRRIMSRSVRAVRDEFFASRDDPSLRFNIRPNNHRSQRLASSVGAVLTSGDEEFQVWRLHRG